MNGEGEEERGLVAWLPFWAALIAFVWWALS